MVDAVQSSYDKFENIPLIPYNLVNCLMDNNEDIWKLLAYNDANAWKSDSMHPDLTMTQKANLIY